jgi:hypothetical protein
MVVVAEHYYIHCSYDLQSFRGLAPTGIKTDFVSSLPN